LSAIEEDLNSGCWLSDENIRTTQWIQGFIASI
jgi:hypothetical protein